MPDPGQEMLWPETVPTDAAENFVRFDPLGIILAVMPWNFPFWQMVRFAAPALMAGNTCLLKHASKVPMCARAIEDVFTDAAGHAGLFTTLLIGPDQARNVIASPLVKAATLTGSDAAGRLQRPAQGI